MSENFLFLLRKIDNRSSNLERELHKTMKNKELISMYIGPAVVETFGEPDFEPVNKKARRIFRLAFCCFGTEGRELSPAGW